LEYKGTYYRPGDNIPMSQEEIEHHVVWGKHRFEGYDAESGLIVMPIVQVRPNPVDDRGQEILLDDKNRVAKEQPEMVTVTTGSGGASAATTESTKPGK
jgi:hypothetical protein